MRILLLHSDFIEVNVKERAVDIADEIEERSIRLEDVLVCFTSVEDIDNLSVIDKAVENIIDVFNKVKAKRILIYPYVHLTNNPSDPKRSKEIIDELYRKLKNMKYDVYKAPFGWYKEFSIKVKGHPLSELSRTIISDDLDIKRALEDYLKILKIEEYEIKEDDKVVLEISKKKKKVSKSLNKRYVILFPDGRDYLILGEENNRLKVVKFEKLIEKYKDINKISEDISDIKEYEYLDKSIFNDEFVKMLNKEALGYSYEPKERNLVAEALERFGFEWELNSDYGHMRYKSYASLIIDLISDYMINLARNLEFPVYIIKGTNMFDLKQGPVSEHAKLFGERMYTVSTDKSNFVLRYAACFQQFLIAKDSILSYKNLPFGMLEIADSYRFEQPGEVELGFRLRKFVMPDLHVFCKDMDDAKRTFFYMHKVIMEEMRKINRNYELLINYGSPKMYVDYKYLVGDLLKDINKPALICIYPPADERYWIINIEYHIIDIYGKAREIGTTQIDIGNGRRFGIKYVDKDGKENYVIILHNAIIGSIERYIYALFDTALRKEKPELPLWISPVQVRILPISNKYNEYAYNLMKIFEKNNIRVEVDDRDETLNKKIMDAEKLWIPYIVVVGEKEINERLLSVRLRNGEIKKYKVEELIDEINKKTEGFPKRPLYAPPILSIRPSNL